MREKLERHLIGDGDYRDALAAYSAIFTSLLGFSWTYRTRCGEPHSRTKFQHASWKNETSRKTLGTY